jgi:hypothetical protein
MMPCAEAVENNNLTDLLVQVMMAGKDYLMAVKSVSTPKYVFNNNFVANCLASKKDILVVQCL